MQSSVDVCRTLLPGSSQVYSFKIIDKKSLFSVFLSQYSGDTHLLISQFPTCGAPYVTSERQGNDLITLSPSERQVQFNHTSGWFFICTSTTQLSAFSLRITEESNVLKSLTFDTREKAVTELNSFVYYQLYPGMENMTITVRLIVQTGNPDLYIYLCKASMCKFTENMVHFPERCICYIDNILHSGNEDGDEEITFQYNTTMCPKECFYTIGVLGRSRENAVFWIIATRLEGHVPLSTLYPFVTKTARAAATYFTHTLLSQDVFQVDFRLIPYVGDPDMYISRRYEYPDEATSEYIAKNPGRSEELISILKKTEGELVGVYYVTVVSEHPASYSLQVTENGRGREEIELTPGLEHSYVLEKRQEVGFLLDVSNTEDRLHLSLTPFNPGVFSVCITLTNETSCIVAFPCSMDSLFVCVTEVPVSQGVGRYVARVQGTGSMSVRYTTGQHVRMTLGKPVYDVVEGNHYLYFSYTSFPPYSSLSLHFPVSLSLYLTLDPHYKYLTNSTAQYHSTFPFHDRLTIPQLDLTTQCPEDYCVLYIAVWARERLAFHMQISTEEELLYSLSDGESVKKQIWKGEKLVISYIIPSSDPICLQITPYTGHLTLHSPISSPLPTESGYQIKASQSEISSFCLEEYCEMKVEFECIDIFCWFYAGIRHKNDLQLSPNEAIMETAEVGATRFYSVYVSRKWEETTVGVVSVTGNLEADLYLNPGREIRDVSRFQWKSSKFDSGSAQITVTDLEPGYYTIAVHSLPFPLPPSFLPHFLLPASFFHPDSPPHNSEIRKYPSLYEKIHFKRHN